MNIQKEILTLRKQINKHFIIRITFIQEPKNEVRLVGAGQYSKYVGEKLCLKHFQRVLTEGKDKHTFKLRSKRKIEFVSK